MKRAMFTAAVKGVFNACRRLSKTSGGIRLFTPDGRMVGDIGEVAASIFYQVQLHKVGRHNWDGIYNGGNVQIKTTSGDGTYLKKPPRGGFADGLLMVFKIDKRSGDCKLIYNGGIQRVWDELRDKKLDSSGAKTIRLDRLVELQKSIRPKDVVPRCW